MNTSTTKTKLRPVYVLKILFDHTDEDHCLSVSQIVQLLKDEYEIESYHKTVQDDINLLISANYDIEFIKSSQNLYHVVSRDFDIAELKVLIDAVVSSKFISKEKSEALADKLSKLAGPFASSKLIRNIDVEHRVKGENKQILLIVDTINTAINERKKISFKYFTFNVRKEKKEKHAGEVYKLSPYRLVWNGDYYYVVGYSEKHDAIGSFRVDRISMVPAILEETAILAPRDFDIDTYLNSMFRMYNGEIKQVELVCDNSVMDAIIDRFGEDIKIYANDLNTFRIIVNTTISHIFFSWVFGFCGKVKIKSPVEIKEQYVNMVEEAMKSV